MCVWYRQSAANASFAPLGQVDEWATKLSSFNVRRGCFSEYSRIVAAKTLKNSHRLPTVTFKLS